MKKIGNQYGHGLRKPPLDEDLILSWADAYFERNGEWPKAKSGSIAESGGENWSKVDQALRGGYRGLLPGSGLLILLQERRNTFHRNNQPDLNLQQVLAWADHHLEKYGAYPTGKDGGAIDGCIHERWSGIDLAMRKGLRGLSGGSTLADFLREHRGRRKHTEPPDLTEEILLEWADRHFERYNLWPSENSGPIDSIPDETWSAVDSALRQGSRGMPGGSSLPRLLAQKRGKLLLHSKPRLSTEQIKVWLQSHFSAHGRYPTCKSGLIIDAPAETWTAIDSCLVEGLRGLPGGSSLAKLKRSLIDSGVILSDVAGSLNRQPEIKKTEIT